MIKIQSILSTCREIKRGVDSGGYKNGTKRDLYSRQKNHY